MRGLSLVFFIILLLAFPVILHAQNSPTPDPSQDDEFNVFLLAFAVAWVSLILGGILVGVLITTLVLAALLGLAAAGVLSTSIIVGLYKKSFAAGFKTFLLIICSLGGALAGTGGFLLIQYFFNLHITRSTAACSGAAGGFLGGLLLGLILFTIIRGMVVYFKKKISIL